MVTTKLNLSMTEPQVRQIYAKQGDTGRVLDITLDQTPEDGTLRILRPDGVEVTSDAVTGGEVESGSTFESLTEADVTELTVGIEPVQDLNGYDKPWVGGAGANKWDEQWEVGNITTVGTNGTTTDRIRSKEYISVLPSTAYYRVSPNNLQPFYYDANKEFLSYGVWRTGAFTTPANASYVRFQVDPAYGTTYRNNIAINYPSTATAYEPYSNICPITGHDEVRVTRTGKNLLPKATSGTASNVTYTVHDDGTITTNGTSNGWQPFVVGTATLPSGQYYGATGITSFGTYMEWVVNGRTYNTISRSKQPFTLTQAEAVTFKMYTRPNEVADNLTLYPMVYLRSETDDTYVPFGNTYTTSLGQTVYGGTLDMVSGVLTVDRAMVDMGSLTWRENGAITGGKQYATEIVDKKVGETNFICSAFATSFPTTTLGYICGRKATKTVAANSPITTLADFVTSVTGQKIVYELETPQTYTLTAKQIQTLVGTNNVWASSGDIVNIKFTYGGLLSELPSDTTSIVGKCYCDVEQNGVSSMPFTLNVKKNERR